MSVLLMSIIAGIVGTGLGGFLLAIFGSRTVKTISGLLSFAGGVMVSIVFFELIPEAELHSTPPIIIAGLTIGVAMVLFLNNIIDKVSNTELNKALSHKTYGEFYHEDKILTESDNMMKSGILMFFVIGLHNIPEGLVIGAAGNHDMTLGFTLALMIGIHNIPEGMAISAPLISAGMNKVKSASLTVLAGVPTVLGAMIGLMIGSVSNTAIAMSFSIAGGAMLYAVFGEIIPQSLNMGKNRITNIILLVGVVVGYIITKLS